MLQIMFLVFPYIPINHYTQNMISLKQNHIFANHVSHCFIHFSQQLYAKYDFASTKSYFANHFSHCFIHFCQQLSENMISHQQNHILQIISHFSYISINNYMQNMISPQQNHICQFVLHTFLLTLSCEM